jgi:hypothetical protein
VRERPATWLLRSDYAWMLVLVALGLALRLPYWSGYRLADDPIFRGNVVTLLRNHRLLGDNISDRLAWLPSECEGVDETSDFDGYVTRAPEPRPPCVRHGRTPGHAERPSGSPPRGMSESP